jgi:dimethylamine/trimethylamine dehydrogenase
LTPDDIMDGVVPKGPVLIFDDDHYYMGGVVAESLAAAGRTVTLATTAFLASAWTDNTAERGRIQARLINLGVQNEPNTVLVGLAGEAATLACVFTGTRRTIQVPNIVMVTARASREGLYRELEDRVDITRIGDCLAPGTIAACVRSGHEYAREVGADPEREDRVRHEVANR